MNQQIHSWSFRIQGFTHFIMTQFNFGAIGTKWQIDIYQPISSAKEAELLSRIEERIESFDKTYSRFRADSLVTKMAKEGGLFQLPADSQKLFSVYHDVYTRTNGLVTPLVGNILSDAGYDAQYSLQQKKDLTVAPEWGEIIDFQYPNIQIKKPAMLDFGAGGKGYLIDLVAEVIEANGVHSYCIDAGGDILHKGNTPIRVGLENPDNVEQVIGVYPLQNRSICGSAGNRRAWADFTHVINPKTLVSPKHISAVWVTAKSAFIADIIATALFFVEAKTLSDMYSFEYCIVRNDHSVEKSTGFVAELFTS